MAVPEYSRSSQAAVIEQTERSSPSTRGSYLIYLGMLAVLLVVKLILIFAPVSYIVSSQEAAFSWPSIFLVAVLGGVGLFLSKRTGFPEWWDARVSARARLLLPVGIGLVAGALFLLVEHFTHFDQIAAATTGKASINVPFPASIYFYLGGAIITEILYRLAPLPILLWLISSLALRHHFQRQVFWILAILLSLVEPLAQVTVFAGHLQVMLILGSSIYAVNLLEAWLFRRYGFLAPVTLRLSFYLVWHIIGGVLPL
jgi:hypothetical protein